MLRKFLCVLVVVLGVFCVSKPANAGMYPTLAALDAGDEYALNPYSAANGWFRPLGTSDGTEHWWSGVLIDPYHVLTAGHPMTSGYTFTGLQFGLGSNIYTDPGETRTVVQTFLYPGYTGGWGGSLNDIAICRLDQGIFDVPIPVRETNPALDALLIGSTIEAFGYGTPASNEGGFLPFDGQERGGENLIRRIGWANAGIGDNYMLWDFGPINMTASLPDEYQATAGCSGGGVFDQNGKFIGLMDYQLYDHTFTGAIRVSLYDTWINQTTADVPEPGTLAILSTLFATGAGARVIRRLRRRRKNQVK
jgi:hypothetical protein